ncbi:MAG: hypothetical protein ACI8RZ_002460 [Myxococcota bacterium]|jgi:hypothetical protein
MTVKRSQLDALLSALRGQPVRSDGPIGNAGYQEWNVFPSVSEADFDPRLAGQAGSWIWWSHWAQAAFDATGVLTRPMLLHWHGARPTIQLAAIRVGLVPRIVATEPHEVGGLLVLCPEGCDQETDLSAILKAFAALRGRGCVALPLAGWAQSHGWEDVAGVQRSPKQTAIFWHGQGHDVFDALAMLDGGLSLYWRGDKARLAAGLQAHGFTVRIPEDEHRAFEVSSTRAPPRDIATTADAEAFERPLSSPKVSTVAGPLSIEARAGADYPLGNPISHLLFSPDGTALWVAYGWSTGRERSPFPLLIADAATLTPRHRFEGVAYGAGCRGLRWLPDGRLLVGWTVYEGGTQLRLDEIADGETLHTILQYPLRHIGHDDILDTAAGRLALPTPSGASIRTIGPPGKTARIANPTVRVRRRKPLAPRPWDEQTVIRDPQRYAYVSVALSPDGTRLARSGDDHRVVITYDTTTGAEVWSAPTCDDNPKAHGLRSFRYTPDGERIVVRRRGVEQVDGDYIGYTELIFLDAESGERRWTGLEAALGRTTAHAYCRDSTSILTGDAEGVVTARSADGTPQATLAVFRHGGVSALAMAPGGWIAAGSDRGEVCLLRWIR